MTTLYSEMWAEICFLLSENVHQNMPEREFESQVVRAMEVLGWREFKNEIERQPIVQLGREGTLRPDLIVRGHDKKCLIVAEVKRPIENITRDYVIGQLRSYMRQMKSDFGFLIGTDLRVYYDGPLNPHSDPILLEKVDFDRVSDAGAAFVKTFDKASLLENRHVGYLTDKLHKFNKTREVNVLVQQLTSYEIRQKVIGYLRNEFPDIDDETFSEALQQIAVEISMREQTGQDPSTVRQDGRPPKRRVISRQPQDKIPSFPPTVPQSSTPETITS